MGSSAIQDGIPTVFRFGPVFVLAAASHAAVLSIGALTTLSHRQQRCTLGLTADFLAIENLVGIFFRSAWNEIRTLRQVSSECVAQLHSEMTGSVFVVLAATICIALAIGFGASISADKGARDSQSAPEGIIFGCFALALCAYVLLNELPLIGFSGLRGKLITPFDGTYIDAVSYALVVGSASWLLAFAFAVAAASLRRLPLRPSGQ